MRLIKASIWISALMMLGGCPENPELTTITVTCDPATVEAGRSAKCTASATDQDGKPLTVPGYTWTSSNEPVAKVDATGAVTTTLAATGTVTISASATVEKVTQQGQTTFTVTPYPPQLTAVTVTCAPATVSAGRPTQCTASATDQGGKPFTVSSYTWTSSNESVAKVGSTGKVSTFTPGTATLSASATVGGVTRQTQVSLTVTEPQPTVHTASITANETWREADNPHVVAGSIDVNGASAPTLTLEAGVQLRFNQDYELRVTNGALKALGTPEAPILMGANQGTPTTGYWRGVTFAAAGSASELNHVTVSDCGRASGEGACIALENQAAPVLRHVRVRNSGTAGVLVADDGSAFGTGSTTLNVSGSQGYAMRIGANQASTLPTGSSFTDNASNVIELRGDVSRSQTWPNPGIPYLVNNDLSVESATSPTLTLSAGTVLRFGAGYAVYVGDTNPGGLVVEGTAASPVLFTSGAASPQPGQWRGVHLQEKTSRTSRLTHATIEYAGIAGTGRNYGTGNLNVYGSFREGDGGARPILTNVIVQKGSKHGFFLDENGAFGPGSTGLTARDNGSYPISVNADQADSVPLGGTYSGNSTNAVEINSPLVRRTQTWLNLGIPYAINSVNGLNVGFTNNPTLTLAAGTELRFRAGVRLLVGTSENTPGALIAEGTAAAPIRFVPNTPNPTKGYWIGMNFWYANGSKLDHVIVTHAGMTDPDLGLTGTGNVNVYREIGAFVTNSTLSSSSGCGITRSTGSAPDTTAVTTDFTQYNNTFANNDGEAQCNN